MSFQRIYKLTIGKVTEVIQGELDNELLFTPVGQQIESPSSFGFVDSEDPSFEDDQYIDVVDPSEPKSFQIFDRSTTDLQKERLNNLENSPTAFIIEESHIEFTVEKGQGKNTANLTVYNMEDRISKTIWNFINRGVVSIILEAGYKYLNDLSVPSNKLDVIFKGDVLFFDEKFEGQTKKTYIEASDSAYNKKQGRSFRFYPRNTTPLFQVVNDLLEDQAIAVNWAKTVYPYFKDNNEFLNYSYSTSGNTIEFLTKLAERNDYNLIIDNNEIYISPNSSAVAGKLLEISDVEGVTVIDAVTGSTSVQKGTNVKILGNVGKNNNIIGKVSLVGDKGSSMQGDRNNNNKESIKVKTFLTGINLNDNLLVKSRDFPNGKAVKVVSIIHKGSFEGSNWYTEVIGDTVQFTVKPEGKRRGT